MARWPAFHCRMTCEKGIFGKLALFAFNLEDLQIRNNKSYMITVRTLKSILKSLRPRNRLKCTWSVPFYCQKGGPGSSIQNISFDLIALCQFINCCPTTFWKLGTFCVALLFYLQHRASYNWFALHRSIVGRLHYPAIYCPTLCLVRLCKT